MDGNRFKKNPSATSTPIIAFNLVQLVVGFCLAALECSRESYLRLQKLFMKK